MDPTNDPRSSLDAVMLLCKQIGEAQLAQSQQATQSRDEQHVIRRDLEVIKERLEPIRTILPRVENMEKIQASHAERLGTHRRELDDVSVCLDDLKRTSDRRSGWEAPSGRVGGIVLAALLGALASYLLAGKARASIVKPVPVSDGKCWAAPAKTPPKFLYL